MISVAERHRQQPLLRTSVLLFAVIILAWSCFEDFQLGRYEKVLWQLLVIPSLLLSTALLWIRRHKFNNDRVVLPGLAVYALSGLMLISDYPQLAWHQLMVPPVLGYFCLQERTAHLFAVAVGVLALLIGVLIIEPLMALQGILQYAMIAGSIASYTVMVRRRDAALNALAVKDWESLAWNDRKMDSMVQGELARSAYRGKQLSLIGFQLNDYEQLLSQTNLRALSRLWYGLVRTMQSDIRAGDEVFRQRDDLFILMLPDCPEDGAIVLMERIRRHIGETDWDVGELSLMTATITSNPGEKAEDLKKRLLTRMAKQKRASLQSSAF